MPEFTGAYACHDSAGTLRTYLPGDPVPDWLRDRVGPHLLSGKWPKARVQTQAKPEEVQKRPEGAEGAEDEPVAPESVPAPEDEGEPGESEQGEGGELSFTGDDSDADETEEAPAKPATKARTSRTTKK